MKIHKKALSTRSIWGGLNNKYEPSNQIPEKKKERNRKRLASLSASLILLFLLNGCTFYRRITVRAGADGAKAKQYGEVESGELVVSTETRFGLFCNNED